MSIYSVNSSSAGLSFRLQLLKRLVQLLFFSYKTTNSTQYLGQYVIGYWFLSNSLQDLLAQSVPTNEQLEQDYTNQ